MSDDLDRLEKVAKKALCPSGTALYSGRDEGWAFQCEFSPDVVLRLIERAKQAEDAVRHLWHAWAEAEGEGQPKGAVFGVPETYGDPDFERLGAPAELQRAVLRIVGL